MVYAVWTFRKVHLHEHFLWFSAPTTPPANCICVKLLLPDLGNWWHVTSLYNWRDQSQSEPTLNYRGHFEGKPARVVYWGLAHSDSDPFNYKLLHSTNQVASAQIDLLKHPLVTSLLDYKWRTYGRYVYFGNLFIYVVFLVFLTAFALTSPNPVSRTCESFYFYCFSPSVKYYTQHVVVLRYRMQHKCSYF